MLIIYENCNENFERKTSEVIGYEIFCSKKYSNKNKNSSIEVSCLNCNKKIIKQKNQLSLNNFCSRSCSVSYNNRLYPKRKKNKPKKCLMCSNFVNFYKSKFCSKKCYSLHIENERFIQIEKTGIVHPKGIYHTTTAKKYLQKKFGNNCSICGQKPYWNNKPMIMILDHINGIADDWRVENIRLVCPNCDTQLETYKSKNKKSSRKR